MKPLPVVPAAIAQPSPQDLTLSGAWTARGMGTIERQLASVHSPVKTPLLADGARIDALDTTGAWVLQKLLERIGRSTQDALKQTVALLSFVGESALALTGSLAHPVRLRWRPILYNIRSAGLDALPIVGLLSFLLGIVLAYQAADQLRQFGANIFVADLVGLSVLREFAPLITAIIIAARSGSAYAAQIGTMAVTEELDAMRTIGKAPVFATIIAVVGCFQGFQTRGGAESVGRQTTRSVVQSIFLVIVADALFSIAFSVLKL